MLHPITFAAARRLSVEERRRQQAQELACRSWENWCVKAASAYSRQVLGEDAASLPWEPVGVLPNDTQLQAIAPLGAAAEERFALHYHRGEEGDEVLTLHTACLSCSSQRTDAVASIEHLGLLLARTRLWPSVTPQAGSHEGGVFG
ncbi:DUF6195 family protein [Streptomyces monomycini]|uniref:DUF6195 family protein n=1 Tax=Streptomyces monomycini TaxID=371720 RepID=UPI00067DAA2A|nr:DUF6195 family protein [Streptomyces monomycini]